MTVVRRVSDPILKTVLDWAAAQAVPTPAANFAPGTDFRERQMLGALGGLAREISGTYGHSNSDVPPQVGDWWGRSPVPPEGLVNSFRVSLLSGRDLFGELYTSIVATHHRRKLGTVFTPSAVAEHMFALCEKYGVVPARVIDPGAGVGVFTLGAACKWRVPIVAVDINVATLGFLAARCHLVGQRTYSVSNQISYDPMEFGAVQLVCEDFLEWLPNGLSKTSAPALIIGNPPYTRHQDLSGQAKAAGRGVAGHLISSGLAGMAPYFLAAGLRFLRPSDALCMVLPGSWMNARYGREIRQHIWSLTDREVQLDVFPHKGGLFPQNKVDAVVLFVGPRKKALCPLTLAEVSIEKVLAKSSLTLNVDRSREQPQVFPRTLEAWKRTSKYTARLRDSFAVHRGVATGRNSFFLLNDEEAANHEIPSSLLVPVISSLKSLDDDIIDQATFALLRSRKAKRWLLVLEPSDENRPEVRRYITWGSLNGVADGVLVKQRRHWFVLEDHPPAPILVLPMTKGIFRVVKNYIGARHTNNLYGLYPFTDNVDIEKSVDWLQSRDGQDELRRVAKHYGDGMFKLEPRAVGNVEVPQSFGQMRIEGECPSSR